MTLKTTLWRLTGLLLCTAVFAGTALAGDNTDSPANSGDAPGQEQKAETAAQPAQPDQSQAAGPPEAPGNSADAPGQEKKSEQVQPPASTSTQATAAPGQEKKAEQQEAKADHKAEQKAEQAAQKAAKPEKPEQAVQPEGSKGQSELAHHHVIICHRTGSESNPYVVINIPMTAWIHAHAPGGHPELNRRNDFILKDPASRPGSKDGFEKSACEARAGITPPLTPVTENRSNDTPNTPGTPNNQGKPGANEPSGQSPAGGVAGAQSPVTRSPAAKAGQSPQAANQPAGGVLGETTQAAKSLGKTAATGTLPFTGLPLWIAALIGAALLAAGLVLRRSA